MGVGARLVGAGAVLALATTVLTAGQKTTRDGVYTKAQAERAVAQYEKVCANCHDPAKVPSDKKPAPPLVGDVFIDNWKDRPLGELLTVIRLTMPSDGSVTLTTEEAVNLTAFILQMNKFPDGKDELKNDDSGKKVMIVK